jgi:hypothetical protein
MSTVHIRKNGGLPPPPPVRRLSDGRIVELEGLDGAISLSRLMDALHRGGHRLPVHVAVYITHEIARALRRLHDSVDQQGHPLARVHGSVNGHNVLLLRSGRVRLIARHLPAHGDRHADLFMLGLATWEMLVGWPPPGAESAGTMPVPPSSLRSGLPTAVDTLVLRALERHPRRRYPSAGSLAGDTARFLATRPDPRRGLRLLLHQLLESDAPSDPTGVTRQTRVPWRDGSGALPPLPPPPPSSAQLPARPSETTRLAPVATYGLRAGELLERRPWVGKLGILLFQTVVAAILAFAALLALGLVRRAEPPAPPPATHKAVIVPIERPTVHQPPVIIHVDPHRPRRR